MSTHIQTLTDTATTKSSSTASAKKPAKKSVRKSGIPRTTIALSPESLEIVRQFQGATGLSLSETVSELIERSQTLPVVKYVDRLPTADIAVDGEWITTEDVLRAQAELG